ncbi:MAG: hypothetical protein QOD92_3211 [Acidimicrobiaceae bacterium]|jgi:hypothetical protein
MILIAVVGGLGILAAAFLYIDDGSKRTGSSAGKGTAGNPFNGTPGRSLSNATIAGTARSVEISGVVRLNSLSIDTGTRGWSVLAGDDTIDGTGPVTIQADGIEADLFRSYVGVDNVLFGSRTGHLPLPNRAVINGQAVEAKLLQLTIGAGVDVVRWLDPPASMTFENVNEFSWAGSGEIAVDDQHLSGEYLGAMGSLSVSLTRAADAVQLTGSGGVQQVFVEGQPALSTTATIERLRADTTVRAGDSNETTYVTWAPRATGSFGVCILRIAPRSGHAEWVNVGLQHMPPMFGGEMHPPVGGDTSGLGDDGRFFGGPDAIDSFIGVGDADRRDLSLSVPADTSPGVYVIEIAIEGNFEPVVFSMTVTVAA